MPNPKVGTVTPDVAGAVKAAKGGAVEFRVEKAGILHAGVGKASFTEEALLAEHQGVHRCGAEGQAGRRQGHLRQARRRVARPWAPACMSIRRRSTSGRRNAVSGGFGRPGCLGAIQGEVLSETAWRAARRLIPAHEGLQ